MSKPNPKKWPIEKVREFMEDLADNEKHMGEQAALAVTCEHYRISYSDAEWGEVFERAEEMK